MTRHSAKRRDRAAAAPARIQASSRLLPALLLAMLGLATVLSAARSAEAAKDCGAIGGIARDSTRGVMSVRKDRTRVHFIRESAEKAGCPNASPACEAPSYVVPGDGVLVGREIGDFTCALLMSGSGRKTQGLLPTAALEARPVPHFHMWYGYWVIPGAMPRITIQHVDDALVEITAELFGVVINGKMKPDGDQLDFAIGPGGKPVPISEAPEKACRLHLRTTFGPYLLVDDENSCGVARFTGIYIRV